jgi:hypothetical protein
LQQAPEACRNRRRLLQISLMAQYYYSRLVHGGLMDVPGVYMPDDARVTVNNERIGVNMMVSDGRLALHRQSTLVSVT